MPKEITIRRLLTVAFVLAILCIIFTLVLKNLPRGFTPDANQNRIQLVFLDQYFQDSKSSSDSETLERWKVTKSIDISDEDAAFLSAEIRAAQESSQVKNIPAVRYKNLIALRLGGKTQFAVARLDFATYSRISEVVRDESESILIELAKDENFIFVNSPKLWSCLDTLTGIGVEN